ncbi:hypothetical protein QL285_023824 [Trifolium repens]|nr:hypothetical protein QL285_023824 [Trifolium repens]
MLLDWRVVQATKAGVVADQHTEQVRRWNKPLCGRVKCNIDVSFSSVYNRVGIDICIRDEFGACVLAKYEQFTPLCDVKIDETLRLLSALNWVHELNLSLVDFELNSKVVVEKFHSIKIDGTELWDICRIVNGSFIL